MTVSGWLFDAYPIGDKMILWIKTTDGKTVRLQDEWSSSIYVAADDAARLQTLAKNKAVQHYIKEHSYVSRYERITDHDKSKVLKLTLADSNKATALANTIEDIDTAEQFRLYNVDVLPPQSYFYEHDLYPLAQCKVDVKDGRLAWQVTDNLKDTDYELPDFKILHLDVTQRLEGALPKFTDKIDVIALKMAEETIRIHSNSEADALDGLMGQMARLDPDFVFTVDGDEFVLPYLVHRALANDVTLMLSREPIPLAEPSKKGVTYFSYGKVHYLPSTAKLYGRVHCDSRNSFIFDHSSLQGLFEITRLCRMTLETTSRATIGRCLSSLQFYHAYKRSLLVPWKPIMYENWKSYSELLVADRGGLIFEPVIGVHEQVAEVDFISLYPSIMRQLNVSGETINCDCCPDSTNIVPELGYHVCQKRKGIVSEALELPLAKRLAYKKLKKTVKDSHLREVYDARQSSLKWIGVVSFGYLGHSNSKFGRIDAHIAVCAFDRSILKKACRVAEAQGFRVLHGIVDSLWVKKKGAVQADYERLKDSIERETGFDLSFEGVYKWLAFVHSKQNRLVPVPNRYFGCFQHGNIIKDRGIETRRHDTPPLFSRFQNEILQVMAQGNNVAEVKSLMPKVRNIFQKYKEQLKERRVALADLIFTKNLSKNSDDYIANTVETSSIFQLQKEGRALRAGQGIQYIISDYYRKNARKRTVPVELVDDKTTYDVRRYTELLAETCNSVTEPFGYVINSAQEKMR
jgi:DNA polymerase elongation subunit (family B)